MKDRICVKGRCWLVPAGPHACDVVYHEEISVRVFGVGSVVEQVRCAQSERRANSGLSARLDTRPSASQHASAAHCSPRRCPGGRAIPNPNAPSPSPEQVVEKRMRESLTKLNSCTQLYAQTEE
jgi:hypothetical protein